MLSEYVQRNLRELFPKDHMTVLFGSGNNCKITCSSGPIGIKGTVLFEYDVQRKILTIPPRGMSTDKIMSLIRILDMNELLTSKEAADDE